MRWQKLLRLAIAIFVIVFAAVVFVAVRRPDTEEPPTSPRTNPHSIAETSGGTSFSYEPDGTLRYKVDYEALLAFADGRTVMKNAVITLPDRDGRTITVAGGEMEVITAEGAQEDLATVKAWNGVTLEASDGLRVTSADATYEGKTGMLTVPGPVQFSKDRMTGSGVGATYDRDRDVLWLLNQATLDVAPDAAGGGAVHATAGSAGLARRDHYVRLTRDAHVTTDGRTLDADDLTVQLTPDDRHIQSMALRGNSRITGAGGGSGAENMSARDIDLTYAPDGRTLQQARLMEEARVQLGSGEGGARTIGARTIDMTLGEDGMTVTSLAATENVQVDLPGAAGGPGRRISSAALTSGGPSGLQTATFNGSVAYVERPAGTRGDAPDGPAACADARSAGKAGPALPGRIACSQTLVVTTEPGLGDVIDADFRGHVRIRDGGTSADGRRAMYRVREDTFDLVPSNDDPGPTPLVTDERISVGAHRITFNPATRKLRAETDVRSSLQPSRRQPAGAAPAAAGEGGQLPAILKDDEPVNVAANQLEYDGEAGSGTYTGDARLFQGQTQIQADTIVLDDRSGNLTGRGRVRTVMFFEETNSKTKKTELVQTTATGDTLVYDDGKRLATYTTGPTAKAHIVGTQGDVTGDRIDLFLKEGGSELDRAVADGNVTLKEGPRTATGTHLVYTPENETYVMTGRPVVIEERLPEGCRAQEAASVTFQRTTVDMSIKNNGVSPALVRPCTSK